MKQNSLKITVLLLLVLACLYSCQNDDMAKNQQQVNDQTPFTFRKIDRAEIESNNKVMEKLNKITKNSSNSSKTIYNGEYDFFVSTDVATYIVNRDSTYHSYTFPVFRDHANGILENLLFSLQRDGTYKIFLLQYELTEQEEQDMYKGMNLILSNNDMVVYLVEDENLESDILGKLVADWDGNCLTIVEQSCGCVCSGGPCHNDDTGFASCSCLNESTVWDFCNNPGGGGGTTSSPTSGNDYTYTGNNNGVGTNTYTYNGGNGGSSNIDMSSPTLCATCSEYKPDPCDKIKSLFQDYPNYKQDLINLASEISDTVEHGIFIDNGSDQTQTIPSGTDGRIEIPPCPDDKYVSIAHTHNSPANATYSVFSDGDLVAFARNLHCGKIKASSFVAFLITADGTYYALTIENTTKFKNFIDYVAWFNSPMDGSVAYNEENMMELEKEFNIYYNDEKNAKIKEEVTDNGNDKMAFLDLLKKNDVGITLFETDANFEEFTKVSLDDNNDILPDNCND